MNTRRHSTAGSVRLVALAAVGLAGVGATAVLRATTERRFVPERPAAAAVDLSKVAIAYGQPCDGIKDLPRQLMERATAWLDLGDPEGGTCSGVWISQDRLLTDGHCIVSDGRRMTLIAGAGSGARRVSPKRIEVADGSDLAALVFQRDQLAPGIKPLPVISSGADLRSETPMVMAGFGEDAKLGMGRLLCGKAAFQGARVFQRQPVLALVATDRAGAVACPGDSGGPVVARVAGGWKLAGLIKNTSCRTDRATGDLGRGSLSNVLDFRDPSLRGWLLHQIGCTGRACEAPSPSTAPSTPPKGSDAPPLVPFGAPLR